MICYNIPIKVDRCSVITNLSTYTCIVINCESPCRFDCTGLVKQEGNGPIDFGRQGPQWPRISSRTSVINCMTLITYALMSVWLLNAATGSICARQLLSFYPFPVGHPPHPPCTVCRQICGIFLTPSSLCADVIYGSPQMRKDQKNPWWKSFVSLSLC